MSFEKDKSKKVNVTKALGKETADCIGKMSKQQLVNCLVAITLRGHIQDECIKLNESTMKRMLNDSEQTQKRNKGEVTALYQHIKSLRKQIDLNAIQATAMIRAATQSW